MKHRIRAAGLIVRDDEILLVAHRSPITGLTHWVPPGGGIEREDDSIFACAAREIFEETGLAASLSRVAYIREFYDGESDVRSCEFFCVVDRFSGTPALEHLPPTSPESDWITELRWFKRTELDQITVYPEELRDRFWQDLTEGFPSVCYLGLQTRP
ncbi:MAG: NUDIX hydrolase [Plectolyngbya sp. WJT66-NPBG17]|jgi:8-oxo-dGTP pyrophosphatase MutT (NUDIX family)|nr:NUDIX hydrolase [Plectolyngbya sp. WJT66-NPBG17]